jgi:hypothetical protein
MVRLLVLGLAAALLGCGGGPGDPGVELGGLVPQDDAGAQEDADDGGDAGEVDSGSVAVDAGTPAEDAAPAADSASPSAFETCLTSCHGCCSPDGVCALGGQGQQSDAGSGSDTVWCGPVGGACTACTGENVWCAPDYHLPDGGVSSVAAGGICEVAP